MRADTLEPVVFVTDIRFWQNTYGSHMRIRRLVQMMHRIRPVRVFCLMPLRDEDRNQIAAENLSTIEIVSFTDWVDDAAPVRWTTYAKRPFFDKHRNATFSAALSAYLGAHRAHSVVLEYIRLAYLRDACALDLPVFLDLHDIMSTRAVALAGAGLKASIEIDPAQERAILGAMTQVIAISTTDADFLRSRFGLKNVLYVPYTLDTVRHDATQRDPKCLLFIGARSQPNISGLRWLLDQVMPVLAQHGFMLNVVGTICDAFANRTDTGVVWHGQQDALDPFLATAGLSVNPVFVGGGLKIKCLDSLAHGLPVVTTTEGAAGLDIAVGAGLYVARSRSEFINIVLELAQDPVALRLASQLAYRAVRAGFSDEAMAQSLQAAFGPLSAEEDNRHD
ncbi:MAG: glycosyltransferase [Roseinatronobacter sp.]